MSRLPRARCPVCGAYVALRRSAQLREHSDHRHLLFGVGRGAVVPKCPASGHTVPEGRQLPEASR